MASECVYESTRMGPPCTLAAPRDDWCRACLRATLAETERASAVLAGGWDRLKAERDEARAALAEAEREIARLEKLACYGCAIERGDHRKGADGGG